jgi:hypothetical protein
MATLHQFSRKLQFSALNVYAHHLKQIRTKLETESGEYRQNLIYDPEQYIALAVSILNKLAIPALSQCIYSVPDFTHVSQ